MTDLTDDELLSAFLDDALTSDDAARLTQRLEHEPKLRARLDELERANSAVRDAYAKVVDEPLPQQLLELFPAEADLGWSGNVVRLAAKPVRPKPFLMATALAASVALAIGVSLGVVLGSRDAAAPIEIAADGGAVPRGTALFEALEHASSAEVRELSANVTATPVLTFGTRSGEYCRELELASVRGTTQMLACRRDGGWRLVLTSYAPATSTDGVYRPASGPSPALDAAIDELIVGEPLDAAAERDLIGRSWEDRGRSAPVR